MKINPAGVVKITGSIEASRWHEDTIISSFTKLSLHNILHEMHLHINNPSLQ